MANCLYTVPNKSASGDNFYGRLICNEILITYFWHTYGFDGNADTWDDGFGYEDPCNIDKPLARTFNACYLLTFSAPDWQNERWDAPILNWARRYVRHYMDDLRSFCGDGSAVATAFSGVFIFQNERVELYLLFFYKLSVVERAATLLHEARHLGGKGHNAEFPKGSPFGAGQSGADSDWHYQGAWMYDALYLWWFFAEGARTTSAMKQRARSRGNFIIDNAFATHPGFSI